MKKLALIFSLAFFAFVLSASAQSSVSASEKETDAIEKVDCGVGMKAKAKDNGCCAYSTKSCKAGSAKCCAKDKSEAKKSSAESSLNSEAVVSERKAVAEAGAESK